MNQSKILIVEDERITAEDLKNTLANLGYEITGIASSAASLYRSLQESMPDLVIMDIYLKGDKDGIELATELKDKYRLPVIYLTAYSDAQILERAKVTEPFGFILKPFQERELHSNIEMALHKNRMEKRIGHLNSILKAIRDVNQLIVRADNTKDLMQKTCETLISTRAYLSAWLILTDQKGNYSDAASAGLTDKFNTLIHQFQHGIKPACLVHLEESNKPSYGSNNSDYCKDCPINSPSAADRGTIISKVQYQDKLYGYLSVSIQNNLINDEEELSLIEEISEDLGLAFNNLEEKKKKEAAEDALHKSETLFRHAFDFAATSMCMVGLDGKFRKANAASLKLLEYSEAELMQLHFNDITYPADHDSGLNVMRKLINQEIETASFEKRYVSKNKKIISTYVSVSLVLNELKQPDYFLTHLVNLTESKFAEEKLVNNERLYRTFMNSTSDLAYLKDAELHYLMTNVKQQKFFNKEENDIFGKTDYELMTADNAAMCQKSDLEVLENRKMVISIETFNGKIYETRKFPTELKDGKIGVGAFIRDVTEQKQAEKELQKLSQVVEQSSDTIVVTDLDGIIEYVNPAACVLSGYTKEELIGNSPSVLSSGETSKEEYKLLWDTIKSGNDWRGEFHNRKKTGVFYWERATISPIKNKEGEIINFLAIKEDISERKHNEKVQSVLFNISKQAFESIELTEFFELIKKELNQLMNTSNFLVAFYNEETDMLTAAYMSDSNDFIENWPAKKSITGYVIRHNQSLLLNKNDFRKLEETGEVELIGTDCEVWLGVPLRVDGKPFGAFVIQDYNNPNAIGENELKMLEFIASQVSISIQRQKLITDLQQALVKAEAGDKLKTAFINNISHEIRTPLNGILGFTEMTLYPDTTPEDNELYFTVIKKSSKRLLNTITSYMDISLIVSGTMEMIRRPSNINKLLAEIYDDYLEICSLKSIDLVYRKAESAEELILNTDLEKLRKVISHLLDNAVKFTALGSITFGYNLKDQNFEFFVSDTGTGVTPESLNLIFEAFMQSDVSSTRGYEGSGLGLTIAKGLVNLLGGNLWVESEKEKGSTFYFTIPVAENPVVTLRKATTAIQNPESVKPLILVAEDDDSNYKYIEIVLQYASFEVIRAENGLEAVEICRNNPAVRLILMDIKMPLMDGFEATRQIKSFAPSLPIIALTAHVTAEDEKAAIEAGCSEYVTKPVSKTKLLEIINFSIFKSV